MKKILFILSILLVLTVTFSQEYPATIQGLDAIVTLKGSGVISDLDEGKIEIKILTFQENAEIIKEELIINGTVFTPTHIQDEFGNRYAKFVVDTEGKYNYEIKAQINNTTQINELNEYKILKEEGIYTKPSGKIESDSKEIKHLVKTKFQSEYFLETLREAISWTNDYLTYPKGEEFEQYYHAQNSALETLINKKGVCDEFTNLTAAILRAKGIPTKVVVGITYDGEEWGLHAWLEIYEKTKDKWIASDSTFRELGFVDAGHIKLGVFDDITSSNITFNQEKPVVELKEKTYFNSVNLNNKKLEFKTNRWNEVKVNVENLTEKKLLVPVTLNNNFKKIFLEEGMDKQSITKLITLEGNEKGNVSFRIYPLIKLNEQIAQGEFVISSLSEPVKKEFEIREGSKVDNGLFKVLDITPIITYEKLILYTEVFNGTPSEKEIKIVIEDANGKKEYTETSNSFEQKTIRKIVDITDLNSISVKTENYSYLQLIDNQTIKKVDESNSNNILQDTNKPKPNTNTKDILTTQPIIIISAVLLAIAIISIVYFINKTKYF